MRRICVYIATQKTKKEEKITKGEGKMRKSLPLILLTIIALLLAACVQQQPATTSESSEDSTDASAEVTEPAEEDEAASEQTEDSDTAEDAEKNDQTEDSEETAAEQLPIKQDIGVAIVDNVTIEQQDDGYVAVAAGNLPDGCTSIHESTQTVKGNTIEIALTTAHPQDMMCTQALVPFTENIAIDTSGLAAGEYNVVVNGVAADQPIILDESEPHPEGDVVSGSVTYNERIALPEDATLSVQLQDTSLADASATVLGEVSYVTAGKQVPLPFAISYDPAEIEENHTYSLSARITDAAGNLLFINDTAIHVITNGNPTTDIDVPVILVEDTALLPESETEAEPAAQAVGKTWQWTGFSDPVNGSQEIPQPERYELTLNADGTANIKADCNMVNTTYTIDGSNITINPLGASTMVACPPDSLADQYLQYLGFARIFFFEGDDMFFDLMADGGTMRFSEPKEPTAEDLIGPIWQWTDYNTPNTSTAVPNPAAYSIQFLPDDVAVIVADCNNILAEYTVEDGVLSIQMGPTTAVFCGEESLDVQFIQSLEAVDGFHLEMEALFLDETTTDNSMRFAVSGAEVSGTVTYLQRIALPENAILEVRVQDISLADAPAITIGADTYTLDGAQVPLPYTVYYNPAFVQENRRYSVSARITDAEGKLLFISDTMIPVITNDNPTTDVEVLVVQAN